MRRFSWPWVAAGACVACQGVIGEAPGAGLTGEGGSPSGSGGRPGSAAPGPAGSNSGGRLPVASSAGESPLRRLGKQELRNTLHDLFPGLPAAFDTGVELPSDNEIQLAFSLPGTVSDLEVKRFQDLAEATLRSLGSDAPNRRLDCAGTDETDCARTFVTGFGKRAFRRPLEAVEVNDAMALYSKLRSDPDLHYDLREALGVVVEAMLQAPGFLYRWERGLAAPRTDGKLVRFDAYEVASRLSYFIWNSMPDASLMAAADGDALGTPDAIARQAARLLDDPRADETLADFVSQATGTLITTSAPS